MYAHRSVRSYKLYEHAKKLIKTPDNSPWFSARNQKFGLAKENAVGKPKGISIGAEWGTFQLGSTNSGEFGVCKEIVSKLCIYVSWTTAYMYNYRPCFMAGKLDSVKKE